jgi:uncharacterized membrane protein YjjB (DUF3815 family)
MVLLALTFFATLSYGIIFQVPLRTLLGAGTIGLLGALIEKQLEFYGYHHTLGTFAAAISVALLSQILSTYQKVPATVFSIAGIIPLVPGYLAYTSMRHMMNKNFMSALETGVETALSAGAIAAGLIVGESLVRLLKGRKQRYAKKSF